MNCIILETLVLSESVLEADCKIVLLALCEEEHLDIELLYIVGVSVCLCLDVECLDVLIWTHDRDLPLFIVTCEFFCVIKLDRLKLIFNSLTDIREEVFSELALNLWACDWRSIIRRLDSSKLKRILGWSDL